MPVLTGRGDDDIVVGQRRQNGTTRAQRLDAGHVTRNANDLDRKEPAGVARAMNSDELEARIKNIDERTARIEQILPTLATKEDLKDFPTANDPKGFVTTGDLKAFAMKDDLKAFATKDDLKAFATKADIKAQGELTRAHFDAVAERLETNVRAIAEGHEATRGYVEQRLAATDATLASHDRRILKLEGKSTKRR